MKKMMELKFQPIKHGRTERKKKPDLSQLDQAC